MNWDFIYGGSVKVLLQTFTTTKRTLGPPISQVTAGNTNFSNLRYVDAALEVKGLVEPADNAYVFWFDSNTDLNVWPTISINHQILKADPHTSIFATEAKSGIKKTLSSRILH